MILRLGYRARQTVKQTNLSEVWVRPAGHTEGQQELTLWSASTCSRPDPTGLQSDTFTHNKQTFRVCRERPHQALVYPHAYKIIDFARPISTTLSLSTEFWIARGKQAEAVISSI